MPLPGIWVTGIGLASGFGQGIPPHAAALAGGIPAPRRCLLGIPVVPAAPVDLGRYVPSRMEQKRLGSVQSLGICAAGDALAEAGLLGRRDILSSAAVLVGAMGGERDIAFDHAILAEPQQHAGQAGLNARLATGTRPSLFLSQLPNLLAGNISILFGVGGRSRTMIGEEPAGMAAVQGAVRLLASGRAEVALVGGAFIAEREDILLFFRAAGSLDRIAAEGGMVLGSAAAFLVLERAEHAAARDAAPLARLAGVRLQHGGDRTATLAGWLAEAAPASAILSAGSGASSARAEELAALPSSQPWRSIAALLGHAMEAAFPLGLALAALALGDDRLWPAQPDDPPEPRPGPLNSLLVTGLGHRLGAGLARLERIAP